MRWLYLLLPVLIFGCKQPEGKPLHQEKTAEIKPQTQSRIISKPNEAVEVEQFEDTVKLNIMMRDILAYALKKRHKASYKQSLKLWHFDYESEAELTYGSLFTSADKYLIIKRKFYDEVIAVDMLKLEGNKFVSALGRL